MTTSFSIWLKAQGIFALLMLPTLVLPPMFLFAEFYAWLWGTLALPLFHCLLYVQKRMQWFHFPSIVIIGFFITFLCTYGAAWHFASFKNPWNEFFEWILFPVAGWASAVISIFLSKRSIRTYILNEDEFALVDLENEVHAKTKSNL